MFRRFRSAYSFINEAGERQTIPRNWAGEVSESVANAADKGDFTYRMGAGGKPIVTSGRLDAEFKPVSDAVVVEPTPAPEPAAPMPVMMASPESAAVKTGYVDMKLTGISKSR